MSYVAVDIEGSPLPGATERMAEDVAQTLATKYQGHVLRVGESAKLLGSLSPDGKTFVSRWYDDGVALVPGVKS
jgi:hypothetical protein